MKKVTGGAERTAEGPGNLCQGEADIHRQRMAELN
jgi:hypothetical protein